MRYAGEDIVGRRKFAEKRVLSIAKPVFLQEWAESSTSLESDTLRSDWSCFLKVFYEKKNILMNNMMIFQLSDLLR